MTDTTPETPKVADIIQAVAEKKRPGRPKKAHAETTIQCSGVQGKPMLEGDNVELIYENPQLFKKLWLLFSSYRVDVIEMRFDQDGLRLHAVDHTKSSNLYASIEGRCTNAYFCREPVRVFVKCSALECLGKINKNHYKIAFIMKAEIKSKMFCVLNSNLVESEYQRDIPLISLPDAAAPAEHNDTDYPLKFTLVSPEFKQLIGAQNSQAITVEKKAGSDLQVVYDKVDQVGCIARYTNPANIALESKLGPTDLFSVSIPVKLLQSFATKNIGTSVRIAVHTTLPASFTSWSEHRNGSPVATVKVFTKLK